MSGTNLAEERINRYLSEVKAHLGDLTEEEVTEVVSSVRAHIDSELQERGDGPPTVEMIESVLKELDPPASYAESAAFLLDQASAERRFSRYAIFGAVWLPFGIIMALMTFVVTGASSSPSTTTVGQWVARLTILPLGILAPFACTALGLMAVSEIRKSKGSVVGMPLAVFVGLFYPVLILDAILFVLVTVLFQNETYWNVVSLATILLLVVIDYLIVRASWKAAMKPEFAG